MTPTVGGAVLAGGASRRMGRPKAFIELDGTTLLARAVAALQAAGTDPVVVVGGDPGAVTALGLHHQSDDHPGEGPLAGIITALDAVDTDIVVVLACDLLQPSPDAILPLVRAVANGAADVAVPVVNGRREWLHAAWHRSARAGLGTAFAAGERAPRRAADALRVVDVVGEDPAPYADADRPEDLPSAAR